MSILGLFFGTHTEYIYTTHKQNALWPPCLGYMHGFGSQQQKNLMLSRPLTTHQASCYIAMRVRYLLTRMLQGVSHRKKHNSQSISHILCARFPLCVHMMMVGDGPSSAGRLGKEIDNVCVVRFSEIANTLAHSHIHSHTHTTRYFVSRCQKVYMRNRIGIYWMWLGSCGVCCVIRILRINLDRVWFKEVTSFWTRTIKIRNADRVLAHKSQSIDTQWTKCVY